MEDGKRESATPLRECRRYAVSKSNTICVDSLQLNIGIIAACSSFLKPLLGRLLKLNSSAASYPTYPQYNRSHRAPLGNGYGPGTSRTGVSNQDPHDEFKLQYRNKIPAPEREASTVATKVQVASRCNSPPGADYYKHRPSDTNSEDILLNQLEPAHGIVRTTEYTVKYSEI